MLDTVKVLLSHFPVLFTDEQTELDHSFSSFEACMTHLWVLLRFQS